MPLSYDQLIEQLRRREGEACELRGAPGGQDPALAPAIEMAVTLGALVPLEGAAPGHRLSLLDDDGFEMGVLHLTRGALLGAALAGERRRLRVEIAAAAAPGGPGLEAAPGARAGGAWSWVFQAPAADDG